MEKPCAICSYCLSMKMTSLVHVTIQSMLALLPFLFGNATGNNDFEGYRIPSGDFCGYPPLTMPKTSRTIQCASHCSCQTNFTTCSAWVYHETSEACE